MMKYRGVCAVYTVNNVYTIYNYMGNSTLDVTSLCNCTFKNAIFNFPYLICNQRVIQTDYKVQIMVKINKA